MQSSPPLIYDVGMNNGDDCAYYMAKGFNVIAIEAHPDLCRHAAERFRNEIGENRLTILNIAVGDAPGELPFYVHDSRPYLSTLVPAEQRTGHAATLHPSEFSVIPVEVHRLSDIVRRFGDPHYIKIDIEGSDLACLRDLARHSILPDMLSAEAHTLDIICQIDAMGYSRFKLSDCAHIERDFANHEIRLLNGKTARFRFHAHTAGPFGEDLPGPWQDHETILTAWLERRRRKGEWFDLHATGKESYPLLAET